MFGPRTEEGSRVPACYVITVVQVHLRLSRQRGCRIASVNGPSERSHPGALIVRLHTISILKAMLCSWVSNQGTGFEWVLGKATSLSVGGPVVYTGVTTTRSTTVCTI